MGIWASTGETVRPNSSESRRIQSSSLSTSSGSWLVVPWGASWNTPGPASATAAAIGQSSSASA